MSTTTLMTPAQLWEWLQANASGLIIPVGAVLVVALAVLLVRAIRRGTADAWAVGFSTLTALGFSAEGMYEVTREKLTELPLSVAAVLFLVGEAAMLASMMRAHRHFHRVNPGTGDPNQTLGKHGHFVWLIAATLGFVVSLNSANVVEYAIRLLMPVLAAGMWWMGYADDVTAKTRHATTFRLHPRRIAVVLGIIEPGDGDVATVRRERQTRRMTALAHKVHTGTPRLAGWRAGRLARLALAADAQMVAEVTARVHRAHVIVAATNPANTSPKGPKPRSTGQIGADAGAATRPANRVNTAELVAKAMAKTPEASAAQIAAGLGCSERTVRRYLKQLSEPVEAATSDVTAIPLWSRSAGRRPAAAGG